MNHQLHIFPSFEVGGAQVRFAAIANALGRSFSYRIFSMNGRTDACGLLQSNVSFELIETPVNPRETLRNLPLFHQEIRKSGVDLLVTYNWGAIEWALTNLVTGLRHLHIEDGFGLEEERKQLKRRIWARRLALGRSEAVIVPSYKLYTIALETWSLAERKVRFIPNGIDWQRFQLDCKATLRRRYAIGSDRPVLGTIAKFRPEKNLKRMLETFQIILKTRPATLVIAGDGPLRAEVQSHARDLGLEDQVIFPGFIAKPEEIVGAFDLFLLTSDTEQMPLSILEAMAAGLPVVSVDCGDVKSMVAEANKPFITEKDARQLAHGAITLLEDEQRRAEIGAANLKRAKEDFSFDAMVEAYEKIYRASAGDAAVKQ